MRELRSCIPFVEMDLNHRIIGRGKGDDTGDPRGWVAFFGSIFHELTPRASIWRPDGLNITYFVF